MHQDCIVGSWLEGGSAGTSTDPAAADILAAQCADNAGVGLAEVETGRLVAPVNIREESGHPVGIPVATRAAAGIAESAAADGAAGTVAEIVLVHGPVKQSGQRERHEQQDHHACFYQPGRLQAAG